MGRRTFKNWFEAYKKLCQKSNLDANFISTLDAEAFKETFFDKGYSVDEAFEEEMYWSSKN